MHEDKANVNSVDKRSEGVMFVNVLVFVWPLVCGLPVFKRTDDNIGLETLFRGTSASSFHALVAGLGFNKTTYPYWQYFSKESETRVLRLYKGRDYSEEWYWANE